MEFEEEIREFLIESNENLANLDREIVELEDNPRDMRLISSAFRAIHTIKGTSGFFGFDLLGSLTHVTETLLGQIRDGQRELTPELASMIFAALDEVKALLTVIESTGGEGDDHSADLRLRLEQACTVSTQREGNARPANLGSVSTPPLATELEPPGLSADLIAAAGEARLAETASRADNGTLPATTQSGETKNIPPSTSTSTEDRPEAPGQIVESTIRVDVGLLNKLMNLVGELVLARNQLLQDASAHSSSLQQTSQRLNLITSELQEGVMKTRMQPIGVVWRKLPRVVRDLAAQCGKKIHLEMEGAETELDKTIIEAIKDPLTHVVRNCCDHGIELPETRVAKGKKAEGSIQLRAFHEGGVVNIEISDDGAGIDPERVKAKAVEEGLLRPEQAAGMSARDAMHVIFLPGFTTTTQVTNISGRGVGMDVVKNNIESIGGNVEVVARPEGGTTIRIKIPLTLAIIPGLVVTLDKSERAATINTFETAERSPLETYEKRWRPEERFIIPQANLLELVRIQAADASRRIDNVHGTPVFHHRGKLLPLIYLGRVLGRPRAEPTDGSAVNIVVLQAENRKIGLVVDRICDTQEIVVKPLGRQLKGLICYVGATIMGDGRPALILDVVGLARLAGLGAQARPMFGGEPAAQGLSARSQKLLLFRAGVIERAAVPLVLVDRLEEVDHATIQRAAGRAVLDYRGEILPLTTLPELLGTGSEASSTRHGTTPMIVFSDGPRRMGLIVDEIVDIVDEVITVRRRISAPGILGSAIISGRVTDLLDLNGLLLAANQSAQQTEREGSAMPSRLLVVEGRKATREALQGVLEVAGYVTSCAESMPEALTRLRTENFQLVITSMDIAGVPKAGSQLLETMRNNAALSRIPVLALLYPRRGNAREIKPEELAGFDAYVFEENRAELLETAAALLVKSGLALEGALR